MHHKVPRIGTIVAALMAVASFGTARSEPFAFHAEMHQVGSGVYYVDGSLGLGVETEFLVDTGSGYVALSPATFARVESLPGVRFLRRISGSMANGRTLEVPVYSVPLLEVGHGCLLRDVEVAVIPGSTRDILGLSALGKAAPFALQLAPPVLMLSECAAAS